MRGDFTDNEFKHRRASVAVLILAISLAPAAVTGTEADIWLDRTSTAVTPQADIDAVFQRLTQPLSAVPLPAIPSNPVETLIAAVNAHSASLGFAVDHRPAIRSCGMSLGTPDAWLRSCYFAAA